MVNVRERFLCYLKKRFNIEDYKNRNLGALGTYVSKVMEDSDYEHLELAALEYVRDNLVHDIRKDEIQIENLNQAVVDIISLLSKEFGFYKKEYSGENKEIVRVVRDEMTIQSLSLAMKWKQMSNICCLDGSISPKSPKFLEILNSLIEGYRKELNIRPS
jgi:hypothetical protein